MFIDALGTIIAGTYAGAGVISRVSNINIKTKEFNFYAKQNRNAYIPRVDFLVDTTPFGEIQANYYVSTSITEMNEDAAISGSLMGTGTLDTFAYNNAPAPIPLEADATRVWHPVYFQGDGEVVQFQLNFNDAQMRSVNNRICDFQLHAISIWAMPTSYGFR